MSWRRLSADVVRRGTASILRAISPEGAQTAGIAAHIERGNNHSVQEMQSLNDHGCIRHGCIRHGCIRH